MSIRIASGERFFRTATAILYFDNNKLTSIPEQLGNLSSLKELHLSFNELISIPEQLGDLSGLK
jgi:Leucine-rich repeat (LRR) protein